MPRSSLLFDSRMSVIHPSSVVVLWDIDGTLINHAPASHYLHQRAASHAMGQQPEKISSGLGKTDSQVPTKILRNSGADPTAAVVAIKLAELDAITHNGLAIKPATAITSVQEDLEEICSQGTKQLLLTGNTPARVEVKATSAGLGDYFDFRRRLPRQYSL